MKEDVALNRAISRVIILICFSLLIAFGITACQNTDATVTQESAAEESAVDESSTKSVEPEEISSEVAETAEEKPEESAVEEVPEESEQSILEIENEEPEEIVSVIGTDTGSETQVTIQVTNNLDKAIISIQFGVPFGEYMGENLITDGIPLAPGETRTMFFDPMAAGGAVDYNVYLVLEDNSQCTLHSLAYDNMDAVSIKDSGAVVYVEYISLTSGEQRSSEMSEYVIKFGGSGGGDGQENDPNAGCIGDAPTN